MNRKLLMLTQRRFFESSFRSEDDGAEAARSHVAKRQPDAFVHPPEAFRRTVRRVEERSTSLQTGRGDRATRPILHRHEIHRRDLHYPIFMARAVHFVRI